MNSIIKFLNGLGQREKIGLLAGIFTLLMCGLGFAYVAFHTEYAVLFRDLNDDDAARITEQLKTMKVNYKLDNAGSTILVDSKLVHSTRLELTARGTLIKGGVGFELFDKAEYGMTDFAQKINFQRALQGELTRTIMSLDEVEFARVHLTLPESKLFDVDKVQAKASVTLKLKPGKSLSPRNIEGIQRLVSAAVSGLQVSDVSILDESGEILSKNGKRDEIDVSDKIENKKEIETYLTKKAVSVLEGTYGSGNAIVNVDVTLDYDQVQKQFDHVIPADGNTGVLIEKKVSTNNKLTKSGDNADKKDELSTDTQELKYAASHETGSTLADKGRITRITASVIVPSALDDHQVTSLREVVGNVIGIDSARGDSMEVVSLSSLVLAKPKEAVKSREPVVNNTVTVPVESRGNDIGWPVWKINAPKILALSAVIFFSMSAAFFYASRFRPKLTADQREQLLREIHLSLHEDRGFAE